MIQPKLCSLPPQARGCRLAWSRLVDLGSIDSGSNPGSPTTIFLFSVNSRLFVELFVEDVAIRCLSRDNIADNII